MYCLNVHHRGRVGGAQIFTLYNRVNTSDLSHGCLGCFRSLLAPIPTAAASTCCSFQPPQLKPFGSLKRLISPGFIANYKLKMRVHHGGLVFNTKTKKKGKYVILLFFVLCGIFCVFLMLYYNGYFAETWQPSSSWPEGLNEAF